MRGLVVGLAVFGAACGPGKPGDLGESSGSGSSTTSTTTTGVEPTTGATSTGADTTQCANCGDSSSAGAFIYGAPDSGTTLDCSPWLQDCPEGQKCVPVSLDGDNSWESLICVEVVPNPGSLGDPCTSEGIAIGKDSCDLGSICWNVHLDTGMGTCIGQCKGSENSPSCADPSATCIFAEDGVLTICLSRCDPLLQSCPNMELCIPNPHGSEGFVCVLDASGTEGQPWDVCGYANACDPGGFCNDPALAPGYCDESGEGCCIPFCDLSAPSCPPSQMGMPPMEVTCLAYFGPGMAPPGLEQVGYCGVPM